ncbi:mandelate racemase/muconate lactonizing enzyme family protein [Bifidobacterium sp. ESL0763]|uniref:mandelate racemase/muconate lactonizing enzyme family protein n=1 Tax=Bifidobacterium sp. ESL0763 TaxID=2983227 RepID=UPI0023F82D99|nr:mandelate racemase/muconate lactonizing enzyme family protein [Bifidobacterium sp. ESL0763]MDF7664268.1 mandelate racemase/muconate lactonizing enzyme family protein [Bifidobacterium sp. ESL0763]
MSEVPTIKSIKLTSARVPLPQGPWGDQIHHVENIEVVVADVTGSNGVVGTGFSHTSGWCGATIKQLVEEMIPDVIGLPVSPRGLWQRSYKYIHDVGGAGVTTHALSALDIAYWDLLSKSLGISLWDMLGKVRQKAPVYGSGINLNLSIEEVVEQVKRWKAAGYMAAKVKVGKPDLEEDVERLSKIQEAVPDFPLAVDANQGWSLPDALRAFKRFEKFNLLWIEEPLPSDDIVGHKILRERVNTPIALGENTYTLNQFNQHFEQGSCDYVQADLGRVGGITGYLDIAAAARAHNLPMTPHFMFEMCASLITTVPNVYAAEMTDGGTWTDLRIFKSGGHIENGFWVPPTAPGTGIVVDREYLEEHKF